jgi:hypothetical protein
MQSPKKAPSKKKAVSSPPVPAPLNKVASKSKSAPTAAVREKSGEELVIENFATVTRLVEALSETLELLTQKAENMAYHIIATEELLAEVVAESGVNLARVNARIRHKVAAGTDNFCDPAKAIDIAASIASPRPRR